MFLSHAGYLTIPTIITFCRIMLTPFLVGAILSAEWKTAFVLLISIAFSDFLDGYLARRWSQTTRFGGLLDAIADKICLISLYTSFMIQSEVLGIPSYFTGAVLIRDGILILGGIFFVCVVQKPEIIRPTFMGKLSLAAQVTFIGLLIFLKACALEAPLMVSISMGAVGYVLAYSFIEYLWIAFRYFSPQGTV